MSTEASTRSPSAARSVINLKLGSAQMPPESQRDTQWRVHRMQPCTAVRVSERQLRNTTNKLLCIMLTKKPDMDEHVPLTASG